MHSRRYFIIALATVLISWQTAPAHFLFVRILPPAEGGRHAELYFSDQADAGDPRFIDKIADTKLWLQTQPGKFDAIPLHKMPDRLRANLPSSGSLSVVGECTYGVLVRPKVSFLLRHYPKAIAGRPDAFKPKADLPFEIDLREADGGLTFVALKNGKPLPNAKFSAVALDLKEHTFKADDQGKATWKPTTPGYYAVYTGQTLKEAGTHQGTKYTEIREFTTLSFAWPLQSQGADPSAVKLFQEALAARASWSNFPGFSADIKARADGRAYAASVKISAKGDVELSNEDEVVAPWVREQLESMVLHRVSRTSDKTPVLRFADSDSAHPLGRLLTFEGGKFASSYRVKDRQIMVVNRSLAKVNMTITVIDNDQNADKKYLPRSYVIHYWDAKSGALQRSETIQNRWTRLDSWDLPTELSVLTSSIAGQNVKTMTLSQHRLLK